MAVRMCSLMSVSCVRRDVAAEAGLNRLVEALVWVQGVCDEQRLGDLAEARRKLAMVAHEIPRLGLQQAHINNINTVLNRNREALEVMASRANQGVGYGQQ